MMGMISVVKTARLNLRACQSELVVNLRSWTAGAWNSSNEVLRKS